MSVRPWLCIYIDIYFFYFYPLNLKKNNTAFMFILEMEPNTNTLYWRDYKPHCSFFMIFFVVKFPRKVYRASDWNYTCPSALESSWRRQKVALYFDACTSEWTDKFAGGKNKDLSSFRSVMNCQRQNSQIILTVLVFLPLGFPPSIFKGIVVKKTSSLGHTHLGFKPECRYGYLKHQTAKDTFICTALSRCPYSEWIRSEHLI